MQTELCSTWVRSGGCPYGHKCQFAHGVDELRARQALFAKHNPNELCLTLLTIAAAGPTLFIQDQGLPIVLTRRPMPVRCAVPLCARRRRGGAAARHVATHGREPVDEVAATAGSVAVAASLAVPAQHVPAVREQHLPAHATARALRALVAIACRAARLVIAFGRGAPLSVTVAAGAALAAAAAQARPATRGLANLQQLRVLALLLLSLLLAAAHAGGDAPAVIAIDAPNVTAHAAGACVARAPQWGRKSGHPHPSHGRAAPVCVGKRTPSLATGAAEFLAAVIAQPTRLGLGIGLGSG